MANPADAVGAATGVLAAAAPSPAVISALDEAGLIALHAALDAHRRTLDSLASLTAGEIAHRSRRELG